MVSTFFLGACSVGGFVSHYDTLFDEGLPLLILKGGAGCGKSTLMRAVGAAAEQRGMDVTYILCASDPDSLDGVLIPDLPIAMVDGTAPHVLEPRLCGGSMNYLNLGAFYDSTAMRQQEEAIWQVQQRCSAVYGYVTACLNAVAQMDAALENAAKSAVSPAELERIAACILRAAALEAEPGGGESHRFLSAVTPAGLMLCAATVPAICRQIYLLRDHYGLAPQLLGILLPELRRTECARILCHTPQHPHGLPAHILLPNAQVGIVSDSADFPYTGPCFCRFDLDALLPADVCADLSFYQEERSRLLQQSALHMAQAKKLHDRLESMCRPFVDFGAVSALTQQTIQRLFGAR